MTTMICRDAAGNEIGRREVTRAKRFSVQASADHKAADKARAEIGGNLASVDFGYVTLQFDANGRSIIKRTN